jgi:tetratricopeptide (TPR) repeat protein
MYLKGLLWGGGVPLVLYEVVERIFGVLHWKFLVWGGIDLILVGAAIWAVRKGYWAGLGVLWVFCGMLPFASTAWNGIEAYVSWEYLYVPLVGVAWVIGGLAEGCWKVGRRRIRIGVVVAGCVLAMYYGYSQMVLKKVSMSEASYWRHVYELAPNERASVALGKAYLEEGDEEKALAFLFSPYVKQLKTPCCEMSRYYSDRGDLVAAAVHLNLSVGEDVGMQFQVYEMARAIWCYKAGALDYAEAPLGRVRMANAWNTDATVLLTKVWTVKNYARAARRSLSEALRIAPSDPELLRAVHWVEEHACTDTFRVLRPPRPSWLRYALQRIREGPVPGEIVQARARHPKDPVLQMEAGACLIREGEVDSALAKLDFAAQRLSSCAYVWATRSWIALKAEDFEKAEAYSKRALDLDPEFSAAHTVLGMLSAGRDDPEQAIARYQQSIRINPDHVVAYNNLGNILARQGKLDEAIKLYRQALKVREQFPEAHNNLGIALARLGKNREAVSHFIMALHIKSDYAEAYNNLGLALAQLEETEEALASFRKALRIDPHYGKALNNLITILMKNRRFGEAVSILRQRLSESPDDLGVALGLARFLAASPDARSRNGKEAVRLARQVCRAREYRGPRALGVLAAAYAEEGQYDEAVRHASDALRLATESGMDELVRQTEAQLRLFRSHRPYRL